MTENTFAIGAFIRTNKIDGWVKERLTGLNTNVRYVHNKFMLVDPLSDDPVVVAGSANFSDASTTKNDENMIVVARQQARGRHLSRASSCASTATTLSRESLTVAKARRAAEAPADG